MPSARRPAPRPRPVPARALCVALGGSALAVAAVGTACTAWLVSGSGTVAGSAAGVSALTVSATVSTALYPGASSAVRATVTNPNPFPVVLTGLTSGTTTSSDPSGCPAANVVLTSPGSLGLTVAASGSAGTTVAAAASMPSGAPTACAGVTSTVPATVTGASG